MYHHFKKAKKYQTLQNNFYTITCQSFPTGQILCLSSYIVIANEQQTIQNMFVLA